jgi:hypothetical protein
MNQSAFGILFFLPFIYLLHFPTHIDEMLQKIRDFRQVRYYLGLKL